MSEQKLGGKSNESMIIQAACEYRRIDRGYNQGSNAALRRILYQENANRERALKCDIQQIEQQFVTESRPK